MTQTTQLDGHAESPTPSSALRSRTGDLSTRAAGWGALTFAIVVIVQNLIRGASAPGNGASSAQLLSHYSGDHAITFVLVATYVVSGIGLVVFLGGITRHLLATSRPGWALTGVLGAIGIMILFTLVVAAEQALTVAAHMHHPDPGAIQAIGALHNSIGAAMLVVSTVAGPAIAAGHAMALFGVGGLGFLIWLAFMITTGIRLVRTTERA